MRSDMFKGMMEDSGKARIGSFARSFKDTLMSTSSVDALSWAKMGYKDEKRTFLGETVLRADMGGEVERSVAVAGSSPERWLARWGQGGFWRRGCLS